MDTVGETSKNNNQRSPENKNSKVSEEEHEVEAKDTHAHKINGIDLPRILFWKQQKVKRSSKKADRLQRKHQESTLESPARK